MAEVVLLLEAVTLDENSNLANVDTHIRPPLQVIEMDSISLRRKTLFSDDLHVDEDGLEVGYCRESSLCAGAFVFLEGI